MNEDHLCLARERDFDPGALRQRRGMVEGSGFMAYGLWRMAYGFWLLASGFWLMSYGLWLRV